MFDIGFSELVLIGIVALLVLGPERLPGAARTVGALLRRARASWATVRSEVERELAAEELKRSMQDTVASVDPREDIKAAADDIQSAASEVGKKLDERT
ncbi:Sec-independent protein translocase protein TatB [Tahibacter sp. BL]|jgi:sec-independent protein translocase protein TatB|uniref:Sec-independent protein translocase protein TatB n=1 Tax=Tahibacter soli TaxID=2983605 RepID=A0A9X3YM60_9GAMM|nr:Sec-independent protein translocase protein TatB [Tahibacter soli]MDC8014222.1 Sec-independent protein translocase protein TatB [Tahibacter soli]